MITVYGFSPSGNCHKVKLLLEQQQIYKIDTNKKQI